MHAASAASLVRDRAAERVVDEPADGEQPDADAPIATAVERSATPGSIRYVRALR